MRKLPLRVWLYPLPLPIWAALHSATQNIGAFAEGPPSLDIIIMGFVFQLPLVLGFPLLVMMMLRERPTNTGSPYAWVGAFWGFCGGLALAVLIYSERIFPNLGVRFLLVICALSPLAGYGIGRRLDTYSPKR